MKPIIVPDDADPKRRALREHYAGVLGRTLVDTYPGRDWMVKISQDCTVATVFCAQVSLEHGFVLHTGVVLHELQAKAKRAGGEILERFGLHRGKGDGADASGLIRDGRGNVIGAKRGEIVV
jgi:hypothetical protein